jgi:FtsP/CotA-like multicopper oxidase with cupredoxin domain
VLSDWTRVSFQNELGQYFHRGAYGTVDSILINGRGRVDNAEKSNDLKTPLAEFTVEPNFRYRFRIISNGIQMCPMEFSIDNHNLTLISFDGQPIEPMIVESFVIDLGERYDFVVETNQTPMSYWIKVRGEGDCEKKLIYQRAIFKYNSKEKVNDLDLDSNFTYCDSQRSGIV